MLRLLLNIPPSIHLLLLIAIPLLRLPVFQSGFFLPEESLYLLLGQRLADGHPLYLEAWFAGPPIMPWLYSLFVRVFGGGALTAMRIFTCFYIYLSAVYFHGILSQHKLFRKDLGLTALFFVLLVSSPWYAQQMSASLFVLLPMIISFNQIMNLSDQRKANYQRMFRAGCWMMICILASYKASFILLGLLVGYFLASRSRADELFSLIGGLLVVLASVLVWLFIRGSLGAFWDLGVLYYWDRISIGTSEFYQFDVGLALRSWLLAWGSVLVFALIGFFHFRVRFFGYVVNIRSAEMIMASWLAGVILMLAFKFRRLELADFILLVPPLTFYAKKLLDFRWFQRFRWPLFLLTISLPGAMYVSFLGIYFPDQMPWLRPSQSQLWMHGKQWPVKTSEQQALDQLAALPTENGIWVMDDQTVLYQRLGKPCANQFTDFRIASLKFPLFSDPAEVPLVSSHTTDREIYEALDQKAPDFVIDPRGKFPILQERFPNLLGRYQAKTYGPYSVFIRK